MILRCLVAMLFVWPAVANAAEGEFCLVETERQKAKLPLSYDLDVRSATDRAGWIWWNPGWDGDTWPREYTQNRQTGAKTYMPALYARPCDHGRALLGSCQPAEAVFSWAAKVAFIYGNKANPFGLEWPKSYALFGDNVIELPFRWNRAARYAGDVNSIGYAALRGLDGRPLLFDGEDFVKLEIPELEDSSCVYPCWSIVNDRFRQWSYIFGHNPDSRERFLYRVDSGPKLEKVRLDPNTNGWIRLMSEPKTKRTIVASRYALYVLSTNRLDRIMHLPDGMHIYGPADLGYTSRGKPYLMIVRKDGSQRPYELRLGDEAATCDIPLNLHEDRLYPPG